MHIKTGSLGLTLLIAQTITIVGVFVVNGIRPNVMHVADNISVICVTLLDASAAVSVFILACSITLVIAKGRSAPLSAILSAFLSLLTFLAMVYFFPAFAWA